jgi:hypothetical protein
MMMLVIWLLACGGTNEESSAPAATPSSVYFWITPADAVAGDTVTAHYAGELQSASNLTLRYGFDGWVETTQSTGSATANETDTLYFQSARFDRIDGVWTTSVTLHSDSHALHAIVYQDGDVSLLDDNEGLEYHWGLTFPYIGPYLTLSDDVSDDQGAVVSFETNTPSLGRVSWGDDPDNLSQSAVGNVADTLHHIPITGRAPNSVTYYTVSDDDGNTSEVFDFVTASDDGQPWSLLVISDSQDGGEPDIQWGAIAAAADQEHPDTSIVFMPGDLTHSDLPGYWWVFFDRARPLLSSRILVPVIGNHDTPLIGSHPDTSHYRRYFDLPQGSGSEAHYAQEYNGSMFLILNTEEPDQLQPGGEQYVWMADSLAALWTADTRDYDWVFGGYHHPSYNAGERFADEQSEYRAITQLFDGHVDIVFMGHEHLYQRFLPVQYDAEWAHSYGRGPEDGVSYIVSPPSGIGTSTAVATLNVDGSESVNLLAYPLVADDTVDVSSEQGFLRVDVSPAALSVVAFGTGTNNKPHPPIEIDAFVIK